MKDQDFYSLSDTPSEARESDWEHNFLSTLPHARFRVMIDEPQRGPDGWPYLLVEARPDGGETLPKLVDWLIDQGVGLVINPHKDTPDYVLTYGMIWNYKRNRTFITALTTDSPVTGQVMFRSEQKVHAGEPSSDFWPDYARRVMRVFLKSNGVENPKVLVMSQDGLHYDLCFSLESLGSPPPTEHRGLLEALSWFLPPHYSLVLISENGLPSFHRL